jgi:predicted nucleotidyltransferase
VADSLTEVLDAVRARVKDLQGLDLLFLFGSRARGDVHAASDWDFAYLGATHVDVEGVLAALVLACDTDRVDLVDLSRAGGLLRYRVARDGQAIIERHQGTADRFRIEAADFWCDAGPLLEREYEAILTSLQP